MTLTPPQNSDILLAIWSNHTRLQFLRQNLTEGKIHISAKLREEIYIIQVDCNALKIGAYVLKDSQLEVLAHEIEEIKKELEKKGITN